MSGPPRPVRCKRVALIALGVVVGALFVAWAGAPTVAEFVGAYRRGEAMPPPQLPDLLALDGGARP